MVKTKIEQAKLESGVQVDELTKWSAAVEAQQETADEEITHLSERLVQMNYKTRMQAKESEEELAERDRQKQLAFERTQLEMRLTYEKKIEETKQAKTTEPTSTQAVKTAKLKLVITKFRGDLTDWPRFWSQFETEIDKAEIAGVTKYSYLEELVDPKIRTEIDGLPFSSEGYERAKNILIRKYGQTSEVVNAYVENIMSLPTIGGTQPARIHDFYEKLLFNVQSLETMGKLREVNGYVRMTIDKLPGIRGDLVRTDDSWREWNFPKLVDELRKWTERNPIQFKQSDKPWRDKNFQIQQERDGRNRGCVYCGKQDHRSVDCKTVVTVDDRKKVLSNKRLCFNCTGSKHKADDCKSRSLCQICQRRHHTSICNSVTNQLMTATTSEKAKEIKSASQNVFAKGTFELHKWHSNMKELESAASEPVSIEEGTYAKEQLNVSGRQGATLLGLPWDKENDTVGVSFPQEKADFSKQGVLSKVAKIYDPLGLASPISLGGKLLYRDVCDAKLNWDAKLPRELMQSWTRWEERLPEQLTVPRSLAAYQEDIQSIELHAFGDASGKGVAAAVYAVVVQESGVNQRLVVARARLSKKGLTIPRLELVSGHMAVKLLANVASALDGFPVMEKYCWLDSTVALHWIRSPGTY